MIRQEVMDDELLNTRETGKYLKRPAGTLSQWRYLGRGPAYIRVGREVRYRKSDLDAWLEANRIEPEAVSA